MMFCRGKSLFYALVPVLLWACADRQAETVQADSAIEVASPPSTPTPLTATAGPIRQPYFGDLHVHSAYSLDAYITFVRPGPRDAYRFARGEPLASYGNPPKRLSLPLDFAAVTDHAEFLGEVDICLNKHLPAYQTAFCNDVRNDTHDPEIEHRLFTDVLAKIFYSTSPTRLPICGPGGKQCFDAARSVWRDIQRIANEFNQPGVFTTFIGYEWTSNSGGNRHRNVIFRNAEVPATPWSKIDAPSPESLWAKLQAECTPPCEVLTISHNSNQSKGHRFAPENYDGGPLTPAQAALRVAMEPLVEIMQHKGDSECRYGFASADEACNFEKFDPRPLCGDSRAPATADCTQVCDAKGQPAGCIWASSYVRNGLKEGLRLESELGVNPFKLGVIASTDTHNANPGDTEESSFQGHHGYLDAKAEDRLRVKLDTGYVELSRNPGGLAGVWAEANTRDGIFAALKRRETFGTSGTRLLVRFFGGWDFPATLDAHTDPAQLGYRHGVPMGGDLAPAVAGRAPRFLLWAMKAADGVKLQRVQVIKGWLQDGTTHERVYDVLCSTGHPDARTQRCPDNGAQVDIKDCSVSLDKGAVTLSGVWQDPAFDAGQRAFYYTRVLENPSCRWSTYEANRLGQPPPAQVDPVIQERAWSSPIWYAPL